MVNLSDLFSSNVQHCEDFAWKSTKRNMKSSIDQLIDNGTAVDPEVLLIMKELLDIYKPNSISDYAEDTSVDID